MTVQAPNTPNQTPTSIPSAPVSFDVNPNGGQQVPQIQPQAQPPVQNQETPDPKPSQVQKAFKSFATQEDYDNEIAKIRGSYEHKAEMDLLKKLGIKPEEKDEKLKAFKAAYEASLTKEQRQEQELAQLQELKDQIAEKDAIIVALTKLSGKTSEDVIKYVKMAKGLVSDEMNIEQALNEVMEFAKSKKPQITTQPLNHGSDSDVSEKNPFKAGADFNVTEQGRLFKEDPQKARELAQKVGYKIDF